MKRILMALVILLASASVASAQVPSPFSLYAGGLVSMPQGPSSFKDGYRNGWHGTLGLGWKFMPNFQAVAKAEVHSFGFDYEGSGLATSNPNLSGGSNRVMMFGLDGRFSLGVPAAPVKPFALAGFGMAKVEQTEFSGDALATSMNASSFDPQTKGYWNIGAGFELKGSPLFGFFAQVRYVSIATDGEAEKFVPITLGLKFF